MSRDPLYNRLRSAQGVNTKIQLGAFKIGSYSEVFNRSRSLSLQRLSILDGQAQAILSLGSIIKLISITSSAYGKLKIYPSKSRDIDNAYYVNFSEDYTNQYVNFKQLTQGFISNSDNPIDNNYYLVFEPDDSATKTVDLEIKYFKYNTDLDLDKLMITLQWFSTLTVNYKLYYKPTESGSYIEIGLGLDYDPLLSRSPVSQLNNGYRITILKDPVGTITMRNGYYLLVFESPDIVKDVIKCTLQDKISTTNLSVGINSNKGIEFLIDSGRIKSSSVVDIN